MDYIVEEKSSKQMKIQPINRVLIDTINPDEVDIENEMTDRKFGASLQVPQAKKNNSSLRRSLTQKNESKKINVVSTELLIEKMLMFDQGDDEDLDEWNMMDTEMDADSSDNISYMKMMNEMLRCEARYIDQDGKNVLYSIWNSKMGRHSSNKENRESELEQLGPGIILYFKMLKYFQWIFFIFTLISIPSLIIFT